MLALDDAALARIVIGATCVPPNARGRWLQGLAAKLDPPSRPLTRQARWRPPAQSEAPRDLINVRFGPRCRRKSDISLRPRSGDIRCETKEAAN